MRSRLPGNLALAAVASALVLAPAEWLARRDLAGAHKGKGDGALASYQEHDPLLGWRKRPGARARFDRREYDVEVHINSHGLRDVERAYERPDGVSRVLALGDSFIEAYSVSRSEMLTQRLERSLNDSSCPAEVINAGTAGYGTDQEYFLQVAGETLQARRRGAVHLLQRCVLQRSIAAVRNVQAPADSIGGQADTREESRAGASHAAASASRRRDSGGALSGTAALGRGPSRARTPPASRDPRPPGIVGRGAGHARRSPDESLQDPPHSRDRGRLGSTGGIIEALGREVRSDRAALLIAYVPSRMEVRDGDWQLTVLQHDLNEDVWDRGLVARRLRELASRIGVPFLDLTPDLRGAERGWGSP